MSPRFILITACLLLTSRLALAHPNTPHPSPLPIIVTGYALIGNTPYVSLLDSKSQESFFVTYTPDSQNNQLLSFSSHGPSLASTQGTARIKNQIRTFHVQTYEKEIEEKPGDILLYFSSQKEDGPSGSPFACGAEMGRLAALDTLVLLEALEKENPTLQTQETFFHLLFNPLPPNPSPEDLQAAFSQTRPTWKDTSVPIHAPPIHLQHHFEEESHLDLPSFPSVTQSYFQGYREGWTDEISSILSGLISPQ